MADSAKDIYDAAIQEFSEFLKNVPKDQSEHNIAKLKIASIIEKLPETMFPSLFLKFKFMLGYHYGLTREQVYKWKL